MEWQLVGMDVMWVSFYARSMMHRVSEVTKGYRYSVTFYTPGNLDMVPEGDWNCLRRAGFPIDEVFTRLQFFGTELFPRRRPQTSPADSTETTTVTDQKTFSLGPAVSSVETRKDDSGPKEVLSPSDPPVWKSTEGCYLCGDCQGGTD
eukprot:2438506-Amphidinium_carterae.1